MNAQVRIGVFGGTFDPIHVGHLAVAEAARDALGLQQVLFVPAARQPFKVDRQVASAGQRLAMVFLATQDNPAFLPCNLEIQRSGPSYTVDTLQRLHVAFPTSELLFLIGADAITSFPHWRSAATILQLARLGILARPGSSVDLAALEQRLPGISERSRVVTGPQLAISSSDIRERIAAGLPLRYLVPEAVRRYIARQGLYLPTIANES
jgi:nicotinate-nucleotide adenylyltransferase